jgi:hypothetical protein
MALRSARKPRPSIRLNRPPRPPMGRVKDQTWMGGR